MTFRYLFIFSSYEWKTLWNVHDKKIYFTKLHPKGSRKKFFLSETLNKKTKRIREFFTQNSSKCSICMKMTIEQSLIEENFYPLTRNIPTNSYIPQTVYTRVSCLTTENPSVRGSKQFAHNNGSGGGSTSVNQMSVVLHAIAAMNCRRYVITNIYQ